MIFLDSETRSLPLGDGELLSLRLWAAQHTDRRTTRAATAPECWGRGRTPGDLGAWLDARCKGRKAVWLYAHNLNFDLCTTALPVTLTARGWTVGDFSVRSSAPWMRLGNGRTVLTVCDSWSWLPEALESTAALYGLRKAPLPDDDADDQAWWDRVDTDVRLLARAVLDLMAWWDREQLGRWTISGPSSGWNAWRHRETPWRLLVEPDPAVLAHDRLAIRGGRREAQRAGDLGQDGWLEVDFANAHATVCASLPLPHARGGVFDHLPLDHAALASDRWGVLARVTVTTAEPRYPLRWRDATWYPVGTFTTHLAGPEISWAAERGDLVAIGPGRFHRLGWHLAEWGEWVLDVASGRAPDTPRVAQVVAKGWGRTVPGKFASRSQRMEPWGKAWGGEWEYLDGWDHQAQAHAAVVSICGQRWQVTYDTEGENTYPAVLAWVESHTRARLGRFLDWLGPTRWVQCDTDGVILDLSEAYDLVRAWHGLKDRTQDPWGVAARLCQMAEPLTAPLVLRPKDHLRRLVVHGPQHVITDKSRRLSGIPRRAEEVSPGHFRVLDWPSLRWQMGHGTPGEYHRPVRTPKLERPLVHRWLTDDGECWPIMVDLDPAGENVVRPWATSWASVAPAPLAALQYEKLAGLY